MDGSMLENSATPNALQRLPSKPVWTNRSKLGPSRSTSARCCHCPSGRGLMKRKSQGARFWLVVSGISYILLVHWSFNQLVSLNSWTIKKYQTMYHIRSYLYWLVVLAILKNISQWKGLSHILWKNKKCSKPPTYIYIYMYIYNMFFHQWYSITIDYLGTWCTKNEGSVASQVTSSLKGFFQRDSFSASQAFPACAWQVAEDFTCWPE